METTSRPHPHTFIMGHPSSSPMTPGVRTQARFPPQTSHTSPIYKRMGLSRLAQSPPLEFIEPIGQGPQFHFTRPQSRGAASLASTASGRACATTPQDSEVEDESDDIGVYEEAPPLRRVEETEVNFVIEEWDSESGYDSDVEVVRPDHYEDAKSDMSGSRFREQILDKFKELQCEEGSSDEEEKERIYRRKKKRWSAGIFKRSHSQSIEGDSSYSDNDPLDDVDSTARRLRRRVRGPNRRESLTFIDRGFSNSNNIVEVEEPEEGIIYHSRGPPSIPSDDAFTLDELPFWELEETMEVEFDSS